MPSAPIEAATLSAVVLYRDKGCHGVVAIGGGSSIDPTKNDIPQKFFLP